MSKTDLELYPNDLKEEMLSYEKILDEAIFNHSSTFVPNSGEFHASLMISKMLENTSRETYMLVRCFDGAVSNKPNYIASLNKCLFEKNIKAHILILGHTETVGVPNLKSEAYNSFLKAKSERDNDIEIFYATNDTLELLKKEFNNLTIVPNFALFDDDKLRFEASPDDYSGWGSFNSKDKNLKFKYIFHEAQLTCNTTPPTIN